MVSSMLQDLEISYFANKLFFLFRLPLEVRIVPMFAFISLNRCIEGVVALERRRVGGQRMSATVRDRYMRSFLKATVCR